MHDGLLDHSGPPSVYIRFLSAAGASGVPAPASGSEAVLSSHQEVADGVGSAHPAGERRDVRAPGAGRLGVPQLALLAGDADAPALAVQRAGVAADAADVARLVDDLPLGVAVLGGHEVDLHRGVLVPLVAAYLDGLGLGPARLLLGCLGLLQLGLQLADPLADLDLGAEELVLLLGAQSDALSGLQDLTHRGLGLAGLDEQAGDLVGVHGLSPSLLRL